jgi:phosphoglycerate dehydrogenase-like enzyme
MVAQVTPKIAVAPDSGSLGADFDLEFAGAAVRAGGGEPVAPGPDAEALVWLDPRDTAGLRAALERAPGTRWVQLPMAGVERIMASGVVDHSRTWTCAKGAYAEPVAEHALMLGLAGLRVLRRRVEARTWGAPAGVSLYDAPVTIIGGGGIAERLVELLAPLRARVTVVRRRPEPFQGAVATLPTSRLHEGLCDAALVVLALALTPQTDGIMGAAEFAAMRPDAWLVNVARGAHVDTDALVRALADGTIGGAALDVTRPEPLPDGHPLWAAQNCIVTPHTADTPEMVSRLLAARISVNVARFAAGAPLLGLIDPAAGY